MPDVEERPMMPGNAVEDKMPPEPENGTGTLLPMLIGGLVMIVIGAIVIMNFV